MRGEGLPPSLLPPTIINSSMYQNAIAMLAFTNPLSIKANFTITMTSPTDQFCLFLKQTRNIMLESGVSLDIPIMYTPETVEQSRGHISVSTNDSTAPLSWVYPLLGQPEVLLTPSIVPLLTTKAKERIEERLVVVLQDESTIAGRPITPLVTEKSSLLEDTNQDNKYSYKLVLSTEEDNNCDNLFNVSTAVRLIKEEIKINQVELVFDVVFLPPKPFR